MTKTQAKAEQLVAARRIANELRDDVTRLMLRQFHDGNGKVYQWDYIDLSGNRKSHIGYAIHDASETVNVQLCEDETLCSVPVKGLDENPSFANSVPMAQDAFRTIDKSRIVRMIEVYN